MLSCSVGGGWRRALSSNAPKRKRAVLFGYDGSAFAGSQSQRNERTLDAPIDTVEDALHLALFRAGGISPDNFTSLQKINWTRSSRTDRGVHAATQLVCAKLMIPNGVEDPETGSVSRADEQAFCTTVNSFLPASIRVYRVQRVQGAFNARHCTDSRRYSYFLPQTVLSTGNGLAEIQHLLDCFVGTHSFHNFTENVSPMDPRAMRYIKSFEAKQHSPGVIHLQVTGQSFLKHHIRRMVGLVVACLRTGQGRELVETALQPDRICTQLHSKMPFAPAEPLFLDMMFLDQYNAKMKLTSSKHEQINFCDEGVYGQTQALVREVVLPTVFAKYQNAFDLWLESDNLASFPPAFVEANTVALELREQKRKDSKVDYVRQR
ncbi:tRNA pseudouridine(38-40) synthase [Batrachochytrium salamandrivorans]|nr:tRNA pseudouridine(38-40) synthase [Batrachochytrium salamandrivorans]